MLNSILKFKIMKTFFYTMAICFFVSTAAFAQKKIEMVCTSPSGETAKYKVDSFTYTIFDRDSTATVAQFYVSLKKNPDKFILQWKSKPSNLVNGSVKLQNATTGKTEQIIDFKSAKITALTGTLEMGYSTLNIEAKELIIDGVKMELK